MGGLILGVTGAVLGAFLQGCSANKQPSQGEANLANAAKDVTIPLAAGKMKNPLPETDEVVSQGQEVFLGACAQCHGADAHGDTTIGRNMNPPAMDLSSAHVQHWSDAELFCRRHSRPAASVLGSAFPEGLLDRSA